MARSAFDKAAQGVTSAVGKLIPRQQDSQSQRKEEYEDYEEPFWPERKGQAKRRGEELYRPGNDASPFGNGLLGRASMYQHI